MKIRQTISVSRTKDRLYRVVITVADERGLAQTIYLTDEAWGVFKHYFDQLITKDINAEMYSFVVMSIIGKDDNEPY